jgi:pimeloyl-ACP methyl ester carboxylesterase
MPSFATNPDDGVRIAYDVAGTGEPLILVHGSALSKAIWRGLGYLGALKHDYRVITVDLRGHGRSDKPHRPEEYAMERVVGDLLAVLAETGTDSVHYLGYSFGARAGFALAAEQPQRLRTFISAAGTYRIRPGTIGALFFPDWEGALVDGGMAGFVAGWEGRIGSELDPHTRAAFLANDAEAMLAYFRFTEQENGLPEETVATIEVPALLLAGTADAPRLADSRRAVELMPDAELVVLPGRDHGSTLAPAAEVLAAVEPFLGRHRH